MKTTFLALGLIILIGGLATTAWTVSASNKVVVYSFTYETQSIWEVSGNFSVGDRLTLKMTPGLDWGMYAEPPDPGEGFLPNTGVFRILVAVVDPNGGRTNFTSVFVTSPQSSQGVVQQLQTFGCTIDANSGGLTMENENLYVKMKNTTYYQNIGGITNYSGKYKIAVNKEIPEAPRHLELLREELSTQWPYLFVVPIGATLIGSGVVLTTWATKKPKHRIERKNGKRR